MKLKNESGACGKREKGMYIKPEARNDAARNWNNRRNEKMFSRQLGASSRTNDQMYMQKGKKDVKKKTTSAKRKSTAMKK